MRGVTSPCPPCAGTLDLMGCCRVRTVRPAKGKPSPGIRRNPATGGRVFSYVVRVDSGFAPNPFHGSCTLACCKPSIRRSAAVGDIIIGLSSGSERIVYAMCVAEILTFAQYWADERFRCKRPRRGDHRDAVGDNIYEPTKRGFRQHPSSHSKRGGDEDEAAKQHDLGGQSVLVGWDFVYFGEGGPTLPGSLGFLAVGRGHKCRFEPDEVRKVTPWFARQTQGRLGEPSFPSPGWLTTS